MSTDLAKIRKERAQWREWKNIAPLVQMLASLPDIPDAQWHGGDTVTLAAQTLDPSVQQQIAEAAWALRPWRKGPFDLFGCFIDSEWQSHIKYNLLSPHFDLEGKIVGDIGCNNGYYLFRMLAQKPKQLIGFDPSPHYQLQFELIDRYVRSGITYELLGVEHLAIYPTRFDTLFCLGVLYHRSDPITTLKVLKQALKPDGELFLDTFIIEGETHTALCPAHTYSKIANVHFIPTLPTLLHWLARAGFETCELLAIKPTDLSEQRKTVWIEGESLGKFLDPADPSRTIEGYPAPIRAYVKARRISPKETHG